MIHTVRTLGEICEEVGGVIQTGPFGSQLHQKDYVENGIPVVMPKDIIDGRVSSTGIATISDEDAKRLSRHRLLCGDIVYGRRGDIGRQALITETEAGWLCGTGCLRISLGNTVIEPAFLHYYLRQPQVIAWICSQAIGATMPNLNTSILQSLKVTYPDLPVQRTIAGILLAYDRLIQNNMRRMQILERMATNLYQEWFVDFRFPGAESIQLLPSAIGPKPENWFVTNAAEALFISPSTGIAKDKESVFVPMGSLSQNSMVIEDFEYRIGASGSKFKNGDTLFARITPCLENGKTGFVQLLPSDEDTAAGSTEFIVLRSKSVCPEFAYLMARSERFRSHAIKSMTGASGRQRVQESCFANFFFAHPDHDTIVRFRDIVRPMFTAVQVLYEKTRLLTQTRDLLIPKVISGEVSLLIENQFIEREQVLV